MASQIRVPSAEELIKLHLAGRSNVDVPAIGKMAVQGVELGETIQNGKLNRESKELEIRKEIEALKQNRIQKSREQELAGAIQRKSQPAAVIGGQPVMPSEVKGLPETIAGDVESKAAAAFPKEAAMGFFRQQTNAAKGNEGQIKRFQQGTLEVDGQVIAASYDTIDGGYYHPGTTNLINGKLIRGFKPDLRTDPTTDELIRVTPSGGTSNIGSPTTPQPGQFINDPQDLSIRQSSKLTELQKRFESDSIVQSNRTTMNTINNLKTVQAQGTGALIGSLQSLRARAIAGEKGVLTEKDVERTTGSPELARRFMNALTKLAMGQENPENIAEFVSAIQAVEQAAVARNQQVQDEYMGMAKSTRELSNISDDLLRRNLNLGVSTFNGATPQNPAPGTASTVNNGVKRAFKVIGVR